MIGFLRGKIVNKQPPLLMIDVGGIGYEVYAPMSTFYQLGEDSQTVTLLTQFIVREDAHLLYGFYHPQERDLFRALIKVNGVGPKLALSILSGMSVDEFVLCVQNKDISRLMLIPGVGKKTAERLVIETRDSLEKWTINSTHTLSLMNTSSYVQDAISALITLGYKLNEAQRAIKEVQDQGKNSEELIRLALQNQLSGSRV